MENIKNEIVRFIEPVYRFCLRRVNNRYDAEDLAGEIMLHVIDGAGKYQITSLEAWVWRIAHNRYARYCAAKSTCPEMSSDEVLMSIIDTRDDYDEIDSGMVADEYEIVFKYLHTLSSAYRDILVDYYIGGLSVRELAEKYSLTDSTIKWRLNVSRTKIKERIAFSNEKNEKGESKMNKVYKRINWSTDACNGSMDSNKYLSDQVARAICEAAYEKPIGIEEISLKTGLPTMYIEDALPHLIYGDAIERTGDKYATSFIVLRVKDKEQLERQFKPLIGRIADYFEGLFAKNEAAVSSMDFYGHDFGMGRLGHIAVPVALIDKVNAIKNSMPEFDSGKFPPRKDGGYGWFHIQETSDETEYCGDYDCGCNMAGGDDGMIYYYHVSKYFNRNVYHNLGTKWLYSHGIPQKCENGIIPAGVLSEDDTVQLLRANLIINTPEGCKLNFSTFTSAQFDKFKSLFALDDKAITDLLTDLLINIRGGFKSFVPKRLDSQINQWVSGFVHSVTGYVIFELEARGLLEAPDGDKPLTNGVAYVEAK